MLQRDERRGFKRAQWVSLLLCPIWTQSHEHTHMASTCSHIHTFRHTNTNKCVMCAWRRTRTHTFEVYLSLDVCNAVNDSTDSWALSSFTYFYFSHSISTLNSFFFHPLQILLCWMHARVCVCAHPTGECVCHSVLLQGREGEACLFQGTPPELMFHTCAQCSTLYRASQVHCINCGRNHFIVGVLLLLLFSGMHSITQYSHLNCF